MGAGQGAGLTNRVIGEFLGEEKHKLIVAEMPSHAHQSPGMPLNDESGGYSGGGWSGDPRLLPTQPTGGDTPHNVIQPSLVVNYIIKY
jgi:microcystin-dependent protein